MGGTYDCMLLEEGTGWEQYGLCCCGGGCGGEQYGFVIGAAVGWACLGFCACELVLLIYSEWKGFVGFQLYGLLVEADGCIGAGLYVLLTAE